MAASETAILNLLYRYAELMDAGDLDAAADLFGHALVQIAHRDTPVGCREIRRIWGEVVKLYPCGTPRTKHVITNPIIEVDEDAGTASCRSYYTVLQATDDLPLQAIAAGRYHDKFERVDGDWRFAARDYRLLDLVGNLSGHLRLPLGS